MNHFRVICVFILINNQEAHESIAIPGWYMQVASKIHMSNSYVKFISVKYGYENKHKSIYADFDPVINDGLGGEYVYLIPEYTYNVTEAATGFQVLIQDYQVFDNDDLAHQDMAKGAGGSYRYLLAEYNGPYKISNVWLSRENDHGDGRTININKHRSGWRGERRLYLCWVYG